MTNTWCFTLHHSFGDFLVKLINFMGSIGSNIGFNSKHLSHKCFGALDLSSSWSTHFLSSLITLSAAFDQGVYGPNCFKWHAASLSFWQNPPCTISLALLQIQAGGTPSLANSNDEVSCASLQGSSSPSKVCGICFCTAVAPSGHCTGKHHVWGYRMFQAVITKIPIIHTEMSWKQRVEHS